MIHRPSELTATMKLAFTWPSGFSSARLAALAGISPAGDGCVAACAAAWRNRSAIPSALGIQRESRRRRSSKLKALRLGRAAASASSRTPRSPKHSVAGHRRNHGARRGHRAARSQRRQPRQRLPHCRRLTPAPARLEPAGAAKAGHGPRPAERLPQRVAREIVHELRMAEAHLDLCRVDVDVHLLAGQSRRTAAPPGKRPAGRMLR